MRTESEPPLTNPDQDRAIAVIALAFSADPIARWVYPNPNVYLTYFPRLLRAFGGRSFEHGAAVVAPDCAGAALWLPPGVHPDEETMMEIVGASVPESRQEELGQFVAMQDSNHPTETHWYLPMIGVDPAHQRQGHGGWLLEQGLKVCDRDQTLAYLEATTPSSRALYQRHGFEVIGEIQAGTSPTMWPMVRRPR